MKYLCLLTTLLMFNTLAAQNKALFSFNSAIIKLSLSPQGEFYACADTANIYIIDHKTHKLVNQWSHKQPYKKLENKNSLAFNEVFTFYPATSNVLLTRLPSRQVYSDRLSYPEDSIFAWNILTGLQIANESGDNLIGLAPTSDTMIKAWNSTLPIKAKNGETMYALLNGGFLTKTGTKYLIQFKERLIQLKTDYSFQHIAMTYYGKAEDNFMLEMRTTNELELWYVKSFKYLPNKLRFSSKGNYLAAAISADSPNIVSYISLIDTRIQNEAFRLENYADTKSKIEHMAFSPDEKYLAVLSGNQIYIHDLLNKHLVKRIGTKTLSLSGASTFNGFEFLDNNALICFGETTSSSVEFQHNQGFVGILNLIESE